MRSLGGVVTAFGVALLALNAVMTATLPAQLSTVRGGYHFEPGPEPENNLEGSSVSLLRPINSDAVVRLTGEVLCVERLRGAFLHRLCESNPDEEITQPDPKKYDRWVMAPLPVKQTVNVPLHPVRGRILATYTMDRWDDLAILRQ